MSIACKDHILLTGAGFTKNFGAPLARELWGIILGNSALDAAPDVRSILLNDFDFESVYNRTVRGARLLLENSAEETSWNAQKQALKKAVKDAYDYIDRKVRDFRFTANSPYPVNIYKVQEFISSFAGDRKEPGFFFTLNQDLFLERQYYNGTPATIPGISAGSPTMFSGGSNNSQSLESMRVIIPSDKIDPLPILDGSPFYYIKLHGSSNWYSADQQTMVIGHAKEEQIIAQPLLAEYFNIFQSVLAGPRRLLCIGYSFADWHVNTVIKGGIEKGLRLYILSPESPEDLSKRLTTSEMGRRIWRGLAGYFQFDFKTLFPADQSITTEWNLVQSRFFG